jgi:hypothetical protein
MSSNDIIHLVKIINNGAQCINTSYELRSSIKVNENLYLNILVNPLLGENDKIVCIISKNKPINE